ncbi:GGDEF domain-containing protein [Myxococcota bacterium]|nr:GGDEF domain-containing protein [Myxococcota bacterium]
MPSRVHTYRPRAGARSSSRELAKLRAEVSRLEREVERLAIYRRLAYHDELTGLYNRRCFDERLTQELARAARTRTACSVVVLDIDDFKRINDGFGHVVGDRVLRAVARILVDNQRIMDVACRIGGDELAVILPATDATGATAFRERLERAAEARLVPEHLGPGLAAKLSIGTATFPDEATTPDALVAAADRAMYASKRVKKPASAAVTDHAA